MERLSWFLSINRHCCNCKLVPEWESERINWLWAVEVTITWFLLRGYFKSEKSAIQGKRKPFMTLTNLLELLKDHSWIRNWKNQLNWSVEITPFFFGGAFKMKKSAIRGEVKIFTTIGIVESSSLCEKPKEWTELELWWGKGKTYMTLKYAAQSLDALS